MEILMQLIRNGQPCLQNKCGKNQLCQQGTRGKKWVWYALLIPQEIENISRAFQSGIDLLVDNEAS